MEELKGTKPVTNVEDMSKRTKKRKFEQSPKRTSPKKHVVSVSARKVRSNKAWKFIIPEEQWFPGKITTSVTKGVLKSIQTNLTNHQKQIMRRTCFAHFLDCDEIVVQPQLIHFFPIEAGISTQS
ncbi:Hypothetical predicted protein [Olea europaea subsp. europaea]|uniref:Uncharacterized protein n=1 Tax=Olea europaea subsp. europaea TaxID=158383 RepID=A0A8S0UFK4_OLEEU|nr:Hypothetical predicted protein [Olea europaea subsp. europaea]